MYRCSKECKNDQCKRYGIYDVKGEMYCKQHKELAEKVFNNPVIASKILSFDTVRGKTINKNFRSEYNRIVKKMKDLIPKQLENMVDYIISKLNVNEDSKVEIKKDKNYYILTNGKKKMQIFSPYHHSILIGAVRTYRLNKKLAIEKYGNMKFWDVSKITNMSALFHDVEGIEGIEDWNVSNVTDMSSMFSHCSNFNVNLSNWNVSKVTDMSTMFINCFKFNSDLIGWDVSNVTNMLGMFSGCHKFNGNISGWNVSNVTIMSSMFYDCYNFNRDISEWNVSRVTDMSGMFIGASSFNQDISKWDTSNVVNMNHMFSKASSFNQNISGWNISKVKTKKNMFPDSYPYKF